MYFLLIWYLTLHSQCHFLCCLPLLKVLYCVWLSFFFQVDTFYAFFAGINTDENMPQADIKEKYGENYNPVYGLLERQRHKWAARFIWRRYLAVSGTFSVG